MKMVIEVEVIYFRTYKQIYLALLFVCCLSNANSQPDPRTLEKNVITIPNNSNFLCYKDGINVESDTSLKFLMWMNPIQKPYVVFDFIEKKDSLVNMSILIAIDIYDHGILFRTKKLPEDGGCYLFETNQYCLENNLKIESTDFLVVTIEDWNKYKVTEKEYKAFIKIANLKNSQIRYDFAETEKKCFLKRIFNNK